MKKLFGIGLVVSSMVALVACGSKHSDPQKDPEPTINTPTDNGQQVQNPPANNTPGDGTTPTPSPTGTGTTPPPPPVENLKSCLSGCEGKYPVATQQNATFDKTCMMGTCENVCNGIGASGKNFTPDVVADGGGPVCDTEAANSWPVSLPSLSCANCVAVNCCAQWTAIFSSAQGQGLLVCSNACYTKFPTK